MSSSSLEFSSIDGILAEDFLDAQQLIVLANAVRAAERTVLICPALVATAMSAIVVSSVSPERWLMTAV